MQFLGQGWLEPVSTYRNSQYQLALEYGLPENLAAAAADQATFELAGPVVSLAISGGGIAGSGLGNLQRVLGSEEAASAYQGVRIINKRYAGQVYQLEGSLATKYPNGVRFSADGFPDFSSYRKAAVELDVLKGTSSDFAAANRAAGFSETPAGYTWHHVEDGHTMMLVPSDLHRAVAHTGGAALIRNGVIIY